MWQYRLADLANDADPEQFARDLAAGGWEFAVPGTGVLVEVNRVTRRRYYLRRPDRTAEPTAHKPSDDARSHPDAVE